jgi:hypothetical protein
MGRDRARVVDRDSTAIAGASTATAECNDSVGASAASSKTADTGGVNAVGIGAERFNGGAARGSSH